MINKCQGADVVFKGVFHASDSLKKGDPLLRPGEGYGYLHSAPMEIDVLAVEEVKTPSLPEFNKCSAHSSM
jgi:hypothetical protein